MFEKFLDDEPSTNCCSKHLCTIIVVCSLLVLIVVGIVLAVVLTKDSSDDEENSYEVIKKDSDFIKPKIRLNAEFKLIKTKNGMTGILINDPFAEYSQVSLNIPNGSYTETVPGLAHFGEHMVSGGSEKYPNIYPVYNPILGGINRAVDNAFTAGTLQVYYMTVPYNFLFEKTIDLLMDSFRYPLYKADVVKNEIQPVNSEFYLRLNSMGKLLKAILQQLSSTKTSFNGMACGNNDTLKPEESELLAKKLRGYHMEVKKPENIFFALYSKKSIKELEEYSKKYFTYEMHKFKDDEIDVEDQKKLRENAENILKYDIFDENLYTHGFYFNSDVKGNLLIIFFNLGKVDYKDLQFDILEYITYLFNSQSLKDILIEKEYIVDSYSIEEFTDLENNIVINFLLALSDKGLENLKEMLLIMYKYFEIIKAHGYEKKYFVNFIKYKNNKQILDFKKQNFEGDINDSFLQKIIKNYRLYGINQIFTDGTPSEKDYNEDKLKNVLNKFQYEKSFFGVNTINKAEDYKTKTFLESTSIKKLKYYNKDYLYGKIPNDFQTEITNSEKDIKNLNIREINNYFSEKIESVVPCYKESTNKCKDKNEYDYNNDNEYKGTKLEEENEGYETIYQIDKSSESYLVNSYIAIYLNNEKDNSALQPYFQTKFLEIDELNAFQIVVENNYVGIQLKSFSDNTEALLSAMIGLIQQKPEKNEINFMKNMLISNIINAQELSLDKYTMNLYEEFMNGKKEESNINLIIEAIENELEGFQSYYEEDFLGKISLISFKIAGNIDKNLVQNIHDNIRNNFVINSEDEPILKQQHKLKLEENPFIINYYQISEKNEELYNSILIKYYFEKKYTKLMVILSACMEMSVVPLLRYKYSNAYSPSIFIDKEYINIIERGKYKSIDGMEDDINEVLYQMINGDIDCPNYSDIVQSYYLKGDGKVEKTPDNLFELFKYDIDLKTKLKDDTYLEIPKTWKKLIEMVSPIFKEPKRFSFLVVRPGIIEKDFQALINNRRENLIYKLNESISIEHTDQIDYWVKRQNK